jgi:hypothetical protein
VTIHMEHMEQLRIAIRHVKENRMRYAADHGQILFIQRLAVSLCLIEYFGFLIHVPGKKNERDFKWILTLLLFKMHLNTFNYL